MKLIGLLGGMSYTATTPYYVRLNELVTEALGYPHSARILAYSVDFYPLKSLFHHDWQKIPAIFAREYQVLAAAKPDCIIMACNTLHKAYDIVEQQLPAAIPFLHIVRLTRDFCLQQKAYKVLFLGTAFTMSDDYFIRPLREAGIEVILPAADDQLLVHHAHAEVSQGRVTIEQQEIMARLIDRYPQVDAVILACTELPLIAPASTPERLIVNPAELQCRAAVKFALADDP